MWEERRLIKYLKEYADFMIGLMADREQRKKIRENGVSFQLFILELIKRNFKRPKFLRGEIVGIFGGKDEKKNREWEDYRSKLSDIAYRCKNKGYLNITKPTPLEPLHIKLDTTNENVNYLLKPILGRVFVLESWIRAFPALVKVVIYVFGLISFAWLYSHMSIFLDNVKFFVGVLYRWFVVGG